MAFTSSALTASTYALNEMFRSYVPLVQNRVFPPEVRRDAKTPRITITALTPTERRFIGESWGSNKGVFYLMTFRVDIWDKDPKQVEIVSDQVMYAIWKHRCYVPVSSYVNDGQFILLETRGGSATDLNTGYQLYQRTINVSGIWLSKSQEKWD